MTLTIMARCVACKYDFEWQSGPDVPICPKCFSPGSVTSAQLTQIKSEAKG